jgi:probable phosphoglycerate mutase
LHDVPLGPLVWTRSYVGEFRGTRYEKQERYFVCRVPSFEVTPDLLATVDQEGALDYRWWSLDEIAVSSDLFVPRRLAALLPCVLNATYKAKPIDAGT